MSLCNAIADPLHFAFKESGSQSDRPAIACLFACPRSPEKGKSLNPHLGCGCIIFANVNKFCCMPLQPNSVPDFLRSSGRLIQKVCKAATYPGRTEQGATRQQGMDGGAIAWCAFLKFGFAWEGHY